MRALGADIKHTPKDEGMIGAQTKARSYAQEYGAVYMNQFETEYNPSAYTHTLGKQLTDTLPNIDYFVAAWVQEVRLQALHNILNSIM